jgi:hypothetical protein
MVFTGIALIGYLPDNIFINTRKGVSLNEGEFDFFILINKYRFACLSLVDFIVLDIHPAAASANEASAAPNNYFLS